MLKYHFNIIDDELIQIYGEVKGCMKRNNNGNENLNHFDFYYTYFDSNERLINVKGVCKNIKHMKEKIDKELKNNY